MMSVSQIEVNGTFTTIARFMLDNDKLLAVELIANLFCMILIPVVSKEMYVSEFKAI